MRKVDRRETERLRLEAIRMEEGLAALRLQMAQLKEERAGGASRWRSARHGRGRGLGPRDTRQPPPRQPTAPRVMNRDRVQQREEPEAPKGGALWGEYKEEPEPPKGGGGALWGVYKEEPEAPKGGGGLWGEYKEEPEPPKGGGALWGVYKEEPEPPKGGGALWGEYKEASSWNPPKPRVWKPPQVATTTEATVTEAHKDSPPAVKFQPRRGFTLADRLLLKRWIDEEG